MLDSGTFFTKKTLDGMPADRPGFSVIPRAIESFSEACLVVGV